MARIAGVDLNKNKRIDVALTKIYGIGDTSAAKILSVAGVNPSIKTQDLTEAQVASDQKGDRHRVQGRGDLRKEVSMHIKMLMDIGCYRGLRHKRNLPVGARGRILTRGRARAREKALSP